MCFSPKMKVPKADTTVVPEPAPLTEEPKGIQFGGDDDSNTTSSEVSGRKSLKVTKSSTTGKTDTATTSKIRKSALGG